MELSIHRSVFGRPQRTTNTTQHKQQISFTTNEAPYGGSFAITPATGVALETLFQLSANGWVDPEGNYPLRYRFSLPGQVDAAVQSTSTRAAYAGPLAAMDAGAGSSAVPVMCTVEDALGATATVTRTVTVHPPPLAQSDPDRFLSEQTAAVSTLISQKDGTVPASATLVRVLLSLLQCSEAFKNSGASQKIEYQSFVRTYMCLVYR